MLQFTDAEIQAKAEELGLVKAGETVPTAAMQSRVKAALVEERRAAARPAKPAVPQSARQITIRGSEITVDGAPFPWLVARAPMEIGLNPDGSGTVRLTLLADAVQILTTPQPDSESE